MLAKLVDEPFDRPGWVYEEKYDGYRILAYKEGKSVQLLSRNAKDRSESFAPIARAVAKLRPHTLLLDGEAVIFDERKISRFQLLQMGSAKLVYAVFDCLYVNGKDLRREPLTNRRAQMDKAIGGRDTKVILPSRRLAANGLDAYKAAQKKGFEGLVAKDASSPYVEARSSYWLKVKTHQEDEFIIAGYTKPEGTRQYFGALFLGAYDGENLRFIGKVGTGFPRETLASLYKKFQPLVRGKSPFTNPPRESGVTYLKPQLVGQFSYQEWTNDQKLRQPVFLGLRNDKSAHEVVIPGKESA